MIKLLYHEGVSLYEQKTEKGSNPRHSRGVLHLEKGSMSMIMKKSCLFKCLLVVAISIHAIECLAAKPIFSTTIDFLDYVFCDKTNFESQFYSLERYEQRIKEISAGGVKKIYLRVNVTGLTLYPSKVSAIYGTNDMFHWNMPRESYRLIETLKRYNVLEETIRLGHKYGMKVWAWVSPLDEGGWKINPAKGYESFAEKNDGMPGLDPFYHNHMDCFAMKNPKKIPLATEIKKINEGARKNPIEKILLADTIKSTLPVRIKAKEVEIYTSLDNFTFTFYEKPFHFNTGKTSDGRNYFEITGLSITAPYVKLAHPTYTNNNFTIAIRQAREQGKIYDTQGREVSSVWSTITTHSVEKQSRSFDFNFFVPAGWDYKFYQIGFVVGEHYPANQYFTGVPEFNVPVAMKHELDKFSELTKYPFDGFMINMRTHSRVSDPIEYGYNPEVRDNFLKRYGRDIYKDDFDKKKLFELRGEAIADFFKGCKKLTNGRPVYMSGLKNYAWGTPAEDSYTKVIGPIPWLYKRYFSDNSIDGVIMMGADFRKQMTPDIIENKSIKIGVFMEMAYCSRENYDCVKDINNLKQDKQLDEIEMYEAMILSLDPKYFKAIKE
ncbi:MAG: hypothetical protein WAW41_16175 [Methylobacter sp.]